MLVRTVDAPGRRLLEDARRYRGAGEPPVIDEGDTHALAAEHERIGRGVESGEPNRTLRVDRSELEEVARTEHRRVQTQATADGPTPLVAGMTVPLDQTGLGAGSVVR